MVKATLYVASSINGMMTRGATDSDWVSEKDGETFEAVCRDVGCIVVGRTTFEQYKGIIYPFEGIDNIVLSRQAGTSVEGGQLVHSLPDAIEAVKLAGHERFVVAGGANVISQCLELGLIDEIYVSVHPYVIGKGLNVFEGYNGFCELVFEEVARRETEFVLLKYRVLPK